MRDALSPPPAGCCPLPCCSYWGEALVAGMSHRKESAEECCSACRAYQPVKEKDMMTCNGGRLAGRCCPRPPACHDVEKWRNNG